MARIQLSGTQIPTLSKLNIDGEITLDAASGTSGQVLTSAGAGNTPTWSSSLTLAGLSLSGGTSPLTLNGSAGTTGQVLTSAGSGTTPTWSSSYLSTSSSYFAGHHPEGRLMYNAYLTNDFANARLRGSTITVTQNGSAYSVSNTNLDAMFDGTASFWNISPTSGFTFPLVIEFTLPRTLTYGTWVGIGFGNSTWRANSVKIEVYSTNSSSWVTVVDTASNTSEDVYAAVTGLTGGNSTGITSIRYTLANPNSTQLRIAHIWGYNFASDMWSTTMMPRAGGAFYGAITTPGITLSSTTSPITLNASVGTTGQTLISQGAGNTPAWTSSLTALTGLSSAAGVALPISTSTVSTGNSGAISVITGTVTGSPGTTGAVTIASGDSSSSGANSGAIVIKTGAGSGSSGSSGSITIDSGVSSGAGTVGTISIGTTNASDIILGRPTTGKLSLNNPILSSISTVGGGGGEGGQINFARVTDGTQYWAIDSFGSTATPSLRFIENATTQIQIDTGGIVNLSGALKLRAGTATANTAPLYLAAGTSLTIPVYGAVEAATDAVYITNNPGSTSTGPGRGIVHPQQMVFSQANASAGPSTSSVTVSAFAAANDVLSVLEAAKLYRFRAKYFISTSFSSGIYNMALLFTFSNAPASIKYSFKTYTQTVGTTIKAMGSGTSTTLDPLNGTQGASGTWVVEVDGYFTSHATLTSTLTPQVQINPSAGGNNGATVQAGSWFEIEKLGTSTQTLIAGNWA